MNAINAIERLLVLSDRISGLQDSLVQLERSAMAIEGTEEDAAVREDLAQTARTRLTALLAEHYVLSSVLVRDLIGRARSEQRVSV